MYIIGATVYYNYKGVVTLIKCVEPFATWIKMKSTYQEFIWLNQVINEWFKLTISTLEEQF